MNVTTVLYYLVLLSLNCRKMSALRDISILVLAPNPTCEGEPDLVGDGWKAGPALYPATRLAVEHINADNSILPDYRLNYIEADTACAETTQTATSLTKYIFERENNTNQIVGIVGPGCSEAALALSDLALRDSFSLIHITQGNNPRLEEEHRVNTFASISSALFFVESFIELMKENDWYRIATLVDSSRTYYKQTHRKFVDKVEEERYQVLTSSSLTSYDDDAVIPLTSIINEKARVIFVFAQKRVAARLICTAYHRKMMFPEYQWIFHDRKYSDFIGEVDTFRISGTPINCSKEEMYMASKGIVLNRFNLKNDNNATVLPLFNRTYETYLEEYDIKKEQYYKEEHLCFTPNTSFTPFANSYYDAVWAMALALNNATSREGFDLKNYKYGQSTKTDLIREALFDTEFDGMSGRISFRKSTRSPRSFINVYYLRNDTEQLIGKFNDSATKKLQLTSMTDDFISDNYEEEHITVNQGFGAVIIFLTIMIACVTVSLQMANLFWSNYHSIKATSPNINHLIFSGCYLFMIGIVALTIQTAFITGSTKLYVIADSVLCNALTWCFCIGYSLIFGTVCAKTWRVYRLFRHFQNESPGMCLGNNYLIFHVMVLLATDIVICISWNVTDPWIHVEIPAEFPIQMGSKSVLVIQTECRCQHTVQWVAAMILYKGAVTVALVVLSILNRKVKRKNFQHTKNVNILIYGTLMAACVALPLYFLLGHRDANISFSLLLLVLMTTLLLCLLVIFIPPVIPVLRLKLTCSAKRRDSRFSGIFSTNLLLNT